MDNLQPGDTISNKYGTRRVLEVLTSTALLEDNYIDSNGKHTPNGHAGQWYTFYELRDAGYELTLNDEAEEAKLYPYRDNELNYNGANDALETMKNIETLAKRHASGDSSNA